MHFSSYVHVYTSAQTKRNNKTKISGCSDKYTAIAVAQISFNGYTNVVT